MKERLYAEVSGGTEAMFKALSLLRRKSFDVVSINMEKRGHTDVSDLFLVVEKKNGNNPHCAGLLLSKLVGFNAVRKLEQPTRVI